LTIRIGIRIAAEKKILAPVYPANRPTCIFSNDCAAAVDIERPAAGGAVMGQPGHHTVFPLKGFAAAPFILSRSNDNGIVTEGAPVLESLGWPDGDFPN
jgi:hypothetical protein